MGNIFKVDGPVYKFMSILTDVFVLTVLWLLCSIPVITIGASTTAVYTVTLKMVRGEESYIVRGFFKGFKENLKKGTQLWIIYGFIGAALAYIIWLYNYGMKDLLPGFFYFVVLIGTLIYIVSLIYVFPLTARYENTIAQTIKNSLFIALRYCFRTLQMLFVVAALLFLGFWNTTTLFFAIVIGAGAIMYVLSIYLRIIFDHLEANIEEEKKAAKERIEQKKNRTYAIKEEDDDEIKAADEAVSEDESDEPGDEEYAETGSVDTEMDEDAEGSSSER